ncbi:MAG TPA: phosphotransferase [Bryobacteraceae bacterium]|nr:phosphotransferase [Bryobacteraceae bacterium]
MNPGTLSTLDARRIAAFVARHYGPARKSVRLNMRRLGGGLRNGGLALVRVHPLRASHQPCAFVVKRVTGEDCREIDAYDALLRHVAPGIAPRLLGAERSGPDEAYLYLEWIETWRKWPWREVDLAGAVLERLAALHQGLSVHRLTSALGQWDYEADLVRSAETTLEVFEVESRHPDLAGIRRSLPALRRTVAALPKLRRQLLAAGPPPAVLHGDMHPGNAIVRLSPNLPEPVLLDWGRIRVGSPLEDVCSWLQSLGYWEPEARRRHDSLLSRYLTARGFATPALPGLRQAYWLAGGSNAMAGALRYHLFVATDAASTEHARLESNAQVRDWLRIVRRADAAWRA